MDKDTALMVANFLAKKVALGVGGALMSAGAFPGVGQETQFETVTGGLLVWAAGVGWSWWNDRGKQIVMARFAKARGVVMPDVSTATAVKVLMAAPPPPAAK